MKSRTTGMNQGDCYSKKVRKSGDSPIFTSAGENQGWSRRVARWVDYVKKTVEKGEDRKFQTIWATHGHKLY